ncbi:MAG: GGDEF domain-containing protein [Lachnospiraceae bacterium]|nr:GGDEF domain-containing protein [Lachnospiraceae bacterium]
MDINFNNVTLEVAADFIKNNVDAVLVVDIKTNVYKAIIKKGIFADIIDDTGDYPDLIQKLWFHVSETNDTVTEDYQVFIPSFAEFKEKYSKRLKINYNNDIHAANMMVYPVNNEVYFIVLDELDNSEKAQELLTNEKVKSIQNTYLFSMYIDLVKNETSSISITEISDDTVHSQIKYTDWRMMIVNMIWPDDQPLFLERTDPDYLKNNFKPGRTSSFDCLMQNLEGKYIWVKLTFSRAETNNSEEDFRYVFMVQDIHENSVQLMSTLKKYEELASKDTLTDIYNHGRIEIELHNAIEIVGRTGRDISIMMYDLDFFKNVNDKYGHAVGDMTLKHFSHMLRHYYKDKNAVLGRWGGEEFVVVCYDSDSEKADFFAEESRTMVSEEEFKVIGKVTCSVGYTQIKKDDGFNLAFDRMDRALYKAKADGRNCVRTDKDI